MTFPLRTGLILCFLFTAIPAYSADGINPGLYHAKHKFAEFEIRISTQTATARGRETGSKSYTSWKEVKVKDKGSKVRYKSLGYNLKVNKSAIKPTSFKGHLTATGVAFGLLTFHKR